MNDFPEIENELRALRPLPPSAELMKRVTAELETDGATAGREPENIVRPVRYAFAWSAIGVGLAAAAAVMILLRVHSPVAPTNDQNLAASSPSSRIPATALNSAQYIPEGATHVVYRTQDEGILFPRGSDNPVRRFRSSGRETLQWVNPKTGASLRVTYPSEEVQLIPVSGQ
jgi:hypothetical protein